MPETNENQTPNPVAPPPPSKAVEQVGLRVSLIPADEAERMDPRRGFRRFLALVAAFVVIFGGIVGGLWFWVNANEQTIADLDAKTADYIKQSADMAPSIADAKNTQSRLKFLAAILPQHKTGLKLLDFLEKYTLPSVSYSSISASADGTVNLTASAASFEAYAAQMGEFGSRSEIKTVIASSIIPVYDDKNTLQKVDFNVSFKFNPTIFVNDSVQK